MTASPSGYRGLIASFIDDNYIVERKRISGFVLEGHLAINPGDGHRPVMLGNFWEISTLERLLLVHMM